MALISNVIKPVFKNVINSIYDGVSRFVYNFDGVDDRGSLQFRAINPDGDIDIEFKTGNEVPPLGIACCVVDQSISTNFSQKEFYLQVNTGGSLQVVVGGNFLASNFNNIVQPNTIYRVQLVGNTLRYFRNGSLTQQTTVTRGAARESAAVTKIGAWSLAASFGGFYRGQLYDLKINGVLYPIAERNQPIQLPQPSGLGAELITPTVLENPAAKGSQWTYLGNGRWQLVSDGSYSALSFVTPSAQPEAGFAEFEIESISGNIRCSEGTVGLVTPSQFNTTGVKRWYYTQKSTDNRLTFSRNNAGVPASAVIKNISFKPLLTTGNNLVSNGDFAAVGPWVVGANSAITNAELQINSAAVTVTRQPIATENSKDYLITYTVKSITAGAVRVLLYGNGTHYIGPDRTAAGTYTEIARFNTSGGSFTNSVNIQAGHTGAVNVVADNVSVLEITSLCNPLTLVNTTSDRWQEIVE